MDAALGVSHLHSALMTKEPALAPDAHGTQSVHEQMQIKGEPEIASLAHQGNNFAEMMRTSRVGPSAPTGDAGTVISKLVEGEDEAFTYVSNDMLYMLNNANSMSMGELTTAMTQVQVEAASMQVDLQMKMSVVNSSKDAIETLMKNQ
ncbi:hypothetical protein [Robbsia andropogonis]|nr:hypothetical protein [Robbsia andropogonis]MCP1119707.1 type III secretion protein HrpB2 [Robbsia andropogonis]MCP1129690.1 type III secretion protein HrpB2 [Robbsia andropogonis]